MQTTSGLLRVDLSPGLCRPGMLSFFRKPQGIPTTFKKCKGILCVMASICFSLSMHAEESVHYQIKPVMTASRVKQSATYAVMVICKVRVGNGTVGVQACMDIGAQGARKALQRTQRFHSALFESNAPPMLPMLPMSQPAVNGCLHGRLP